jgi:hypothetical protein
MRVHLTPALPGSYKTLPEAPAQAKLMAITVTQIASYWPDEGRQCSSMRLLRLDFKWRLQQHREILT